MNVLTTDGNEVKQYIDSPKKKKNCKVYQEILNKIYVIFYVFIFHSDSNWTDTLILSEL